VKAPHLLRGAYTEDRVCKWLLGRGLRLVTRNYRCPSGEIDLVLLEEDCLVIVEVRFRRNDLYGGAFASVSRQKQQRLARATECFLRENPHYTHHPLRFDVVAVSGHNSAMQLEWRQNAICFDPE